MSALLLIALSGIADAHRPHSVVTAMANAPDFESTGVAWAIMDPHDISQPMRSVDHGQHWNYMGGAPMDDELVGASYVGDDLVLLGRDGTLWVTTDEGGSWSSRDVVSETLANALTVDGDRLVVAADSGLWVGTLQSTFEAIESTRAWDRVATSPTDADAGMALTSEGDVWRTEDGWDSVTRIKPPPLGLTFYDATLVDGGIVAGSVGPVVRYDITTDTWEDCAELPRQSSESHSDDVIRLTGTPDGRIGAATGREALFVSDDGCTSWTLWDSQVVPIYGGIGNAQEALEGFTEIFLEGDRGLVGGFQGVATAQEADGDWQAAKLIPADYCRGIAFAPDWPDDPRIFVGAYGGGVWWTADGGASWDGSAVGMEGVYAYDVQPAADLASTGVVYYSGSNQPYRSPDDGETWTRFELPMERVRLFRPFGQRVYALGEDAAGGVEGQVAYSDDGGTVWVEFPGNLYDLMAKGAPRDIQETSLDGEDLLYVVVDSPAGILGSTDRGLTWSWYHQGARETAAGAAAWPPDAPTRLVFASATAGVITSDDAGETWTAASTAPVGRPRHMTQADDGTLLLGTRSGQLWRSDDGGEVWEAVGDPVAPALFDIVAGRDFAEHGAALLGTQEGPYWTMDRGETWQPLPRYERFEARSVHFQCLPGGVEGTGESCATYEDRSDGFGGGYALEAGDILRFTFEGDEFALVGAGEGDGTLALTLNGQDEGELVADGRKLRVQDLDSGWKDIELEVLEAGPDGFRIDLVEAWGDGSRMPVGTPDTGPEDTGIPCSGTCGCRGGEGPACALLLVLPFWWRRRDWS